MTQTKGMCFFIATNWRDGVISDHFRKLAQNLADRGHRVILIVDRHRYDIEDHNSNPAIYVWPSMIPTKLRDMYFLFKLIRQYDPDCLISNFSAVNAMTLVGWIARVPCRVAWYWTTSNQSVYESDGPSYLQRQYQIQRKKLVYRLATRILTSTEAMKRDLENVYQVLGSKVDIFPNTISAPDKALLDRAKDKNQIICVGRLCVLKGQETLLRAIAHIKTDFPDLKVDFFGTGPLLQHFQELADELGIEHICHFKGAIPHQSVLENMASSAITIVPSKDEAFGYVNIESMSVGTPVIASNVGGIPEIVRDGLDGFLVPPDDPKTLAQRINQLLSTPTLRAEMGRNARERFLKNYEQRESIEKQVAYFENQN